MAIGEEDKKATATDKGKGKEKTSETNGVNGSEKKEPKKDKDGNVIKDDRERGEGERPLDWVAASLLWLTDVSLSIQRSSQRKTSS